MILTTTEYNNIHNKVLKAFANTGHASMVNEVYGLRHKKFSHRMWLFAWALSLYEHGADDNYITEEQVIAMGKQVQKHAVYP